MMLRTSHSSSEIAYLDIETAALLAKLGGRNDW